MLPMLHPGPHSEKQGLRTHSHLPIELSPKQSAVRPFKSLFVGWLILCPDGDTEKLAKAAKMGVLVMRNSSVTHPFLALGQEEFPLVARPPYDLMT